MHQPIDSTDTPGPPDLRILLLSTPKTGNTWLRNLLAGIYRLPQITLTQWPFHPAPFAAAGPRWVTHHHYPRTPEIGNFVRQNGIVLLTTVRHPADVLISMFHHITRFAHAQPDLDQLRQMLRADFARTGIIPATVGAPFSADLDCSLEWAQSALSRVVRYEDLRSDTYAVLEQLTRQIAPVAPARIENAIQACELDLMRKLAGTFGGFFRQGAIGEWRNILPPDIIETFRRPPYAAQFAALGYSLDGATPHPAPPAQLHPFTSLSHFSNGIPVAPILKKCFFLGAGGPRESWLADLAATGPGSFYQWLNEPAPRHPGVSNLARFLYEQRDDVAAAFPDPDSTSHAAFLEWFSRYAPAEYGLDKSFCDRR